MAKKVDDDQRRAEIQAEKFLSLSNRAKKLGELRECLAVVRGLLLNGTPERARIIVAFDDGTERRHMVYGSIRDFWKQLVSERTAIGIPILGATETTLREQIRKQEAALRDMGVTDI